MNRFVWLAAVSFTALTTGVALNRLAQSAQGQDSPTLDRPAVTSSLQVGPAFDNQAQARFEAGLNDADRVRLVPLRSRYALADATCPVPVEDPRQPFCVRLRRDMDRAFADELMAAGAGLIGYARPHVHILRAINAEALVRIRDLLRGSNAVAGTLLLQPLDRQSRGLFERREVPPQAAYRVLFWRDARADDAKALLLAAGATLLAATRDESGTIDLDTPYVDVAADGPGLAALLASPWVENVSLAPWKVETNQVSAGMSNATSAIIGIAPYNLDGTNQIVGVWDSGPARDTHEQFQGAPATSLINNGTKRILRVDTSTNTNHGTHVTGTIIGDGTNNAGAKGFAPKAYVVSHDWNNIDQERREAKHNWNHVADNHSYADFTGGSDDWGDYTAGTQQVDFTNRDFLLCQVQSAGNYAGSQPGGTGAKPFSGGTCTVPSYNAHRNGFVIAAAQDNMDITGFSSRGPALDGRLVPQFCANGEGLTSAIATGNTAYDSYSGTSMSGPSFCGGVTLLSQLWRREHSDRLLAPDEARSIIGLTCIDRGNTGPDYVYGLGIIDVKAAADLILADKASGGKRVVRGQVRQGGVVSYSVNVTAGAPALRVCMSWLDIYASTAASVTLVNDLDVELIDPASGTHYPYAGLSACVAGAQSHVFTTTGPNRRDNIELAHVANPAAGTWTVRVRGFSLPANPQTGFPNDVQGFVLASSHDLGVQKLSFEDALNGNTPVSIPDNNTTGVTRTFNVSDSRVITQVRVYARIMHERRGDLRIVLEHPDTTQVVLKTVNSGDEDDYTDIIAVYPDTRQHDDDITSLIHKHVSGAWKVIISDRAAGNTGSIHYLALELDVRVNNAPVANAGSNFTVRETLGGQLNGSGSADADGDAITYLWTQVGGTPTVTLSNAGAISPTFTAPVVTSDQVVTFQLRTTDTSGDFTTDTVQFTILNNQAPAADAGADFDVRETQQGQLNAGGSSNAESDPMTYVWAQVGGSITVTLSSTTAAAPTFTAPSVSSNTVLTFQVTVTDSFSASSADAVQVTILNNQAPVADAGTALSVRETQAGQLNATGSSDPESDTITFQWLQISGAVTLVPSSATAATPSFNAPAVNQDEICIFQITVTDSFGDFSTDTVQVTVLNNQAPVADAGPAQAVIEGDPVSLTAAGSSDPESDALSHSWTQVGGTSVSLAGATTATPTFTAPAVTANEVLTFEVTVTDSFGDFSTDTVDVTIEVNLPPDANAGAALALMHGAAGGLDASASSDPNTGDVLSFAWTQVGGTATVSLTGAATAQPTFNAPTTDDVLRFEVTVTDLRGLSDTATVEVHVNATGTLPIVSGSGGGGGDKGGGGCASRATGGTWWLALIGVALALSWRRRQRA